jgi:hypothetical protein
VAIGRPEAIAKRQRIIAWFQAHRHYGFDVLAAVQDLKTLDSHVRDLYEFHSEVRNMKKLPWLGLLVRFNLFMRTTRWNDRARTKAGVSCYWLSKSLARLYHTHALEGVDWPPDAIVLPRVDGDLGGGGEASGARAEGGATNGATPVLELACPPDPVWAPEASALADGGADG